MALLQNFWQNSQSVPLCPKDPPREDVPHGEENSPLILYGKFNWNICDFVVINTTTIGVEKRDIEGLFIFPSMVITLAVNGTVNNVGVKFNGRLEELRHA